MVASVLQAPLLLKDAMERELDAINNEFKMIQPDDNARAMQILQSSTSDKNHIFNRFAWGNNKSIKGQDEETMWNDLRAFYENNYSADRITLVIQVKTDDDMQEV